jgi:iron complex transport system ATP-binding protein
LIDVSDLTVGYGNKSVINRLSFSVLPDDGPLVLAGRNGSGKSTLFKALLGQIPFNGSVSMPGPVAWMPQQARIAFRLPVVDFISLGAAGTTGLFPSIPKGSGEQAIQLLEEFQLNHLQTAWTDTLSGGEWQLVCLAQMAMQNARVWLLDEPSSSLDIFYKDLLFRQIWKQQEKGIQVVFSTHDLPFLPDLPGKLLLFGSDSGLSDLSPERIQDAMAFLSRKS